MVVCVRGVGGAPAAQWTIKIFKDQSILSQYGRTHPFPEPTPTPLGYLWIFFLQSDSSENMGHRDVIESATFISKCIHHTLMDP